MLVLAALGFLAAIGLLAGLAIFGTQQEVAMQKLMYRTRDGCADYRFGFARLTDGTWRVYIMRRPNYGSRDTSLHATHRLRDINGHYYVCWTNPLQSNAEALQVAALWADNTQEYIRTGRRF